MDVDNTLLGDIYIVVNILNRDLVHKLSEQINGVIRFK